MSPHVVIYGGSGALGSAVVSYFKSKGWITTSIDLAANKSSDHSVVLPTSMSLIETADFAINQVKSNLKNEKLDAIICVAGGWVSGNAADKDFVKSVEVSYSQHIQTSVVAAKLAAECLKESGLLSFTGAYSALNPTPTSIGYGFCKAAVHQLVSSLAHPDSGLPKNSKTIAILPVTLDTPMNRKFMPNADFGTWTSLEFVANLLYKYASDPSTVPHNGKLLGLFTKTGETKIEVLKS